MKTEFASGILRAAKKDKKLIFLTGDLGFNAFETVRDAIGDRFINAGVAEQNMLDVAAGMAYAGLHPWVYSIAPFLILKTVEQIRNDICQRNLPVRLVGNGGGFGYGIMASTHHLLEDIAILSTFPNIRLFIPAFLSDIEPMIQAMQAHTGPSYLRLSVSQLTQPTYAPCRRIARGNQATVIVLGSLVTSVLPALAKLKGKLDIWVISELPLQLPQGLLASVKQTKKLMVIEEHVLNGGVGQMIFTELGRRGILSKISHLATNGYPSKLYGSHGYHLKDNGLDTESVVRSLKKLLNR
jgi:transketolase